ncbi:outer membrane lipoprotein-sorting protein [bacterium]|nr:outer membrane lipoprotein-sorting protein [bacterium]
MSPSASVVRIEILFLLLCCLMPFSQPYAQENFDVREIVARVDKLYRSETSYAEMEMTIETPHWERTLRLEAWTQGMDRTFIHILAPKKDQGVTTLRVEQDMWNYFPKINKVMKVPPSMMMGSWMGSDFTNDDLVKESTLLDDYVASLVQPEDALPGHYYIKLVPREQTATVWGKIVLVVRKSDLFPLKEEYYDEKGTLMRTMEFQDMQILGGRKLPVTMIMIPLNKEKHRTIIRYLKAEFDLELDAEVFTLRNLQKKR